MKDPLLIHSSDQVDGIPHEAMRELVIDRVPPDEQVRGPEPAPAMLPQAASKQGVLKKSRLSIALATLVAVLAFIASSGMAEPESLLLLGVALLGVAAVVRRLFHREARGVVSIESRRMVAVGVEDLLMTSPVKVVVSPAESVGTRVVLAGILAELVVVYAPTVRWLFDRWTMSVWHNAHGLLIVPVIIYFVYQALRPVAHLPRSASAWGFAVLVPALALQALDTGIQTQLLSAVSLIVALPGLSLLFLGPQRTKVILFPLAFSVFMLPLPLAVTDPLQLQLRKIATVGTAFIVPRLGIPVFVEGTTLHMPNASLLVSDACSGFSTLYAAAAVACLTAYASQSTRRRVLVMLAAVPLAIAANILRVALIVLLVFWQGSDVLATSLHPLSGMLTFVLVLPLLFWLGRDPEGPKAGLL